MIANHSFEEPQSSDFPQVSARLAAISARAQTAPALRLQETGRLWRWSRPALNPDGSAQKPPTDMPFVSANVGPTPLVFCLSARDWGVLDERLVPPNDRIPADIQSALQSAALYDAVEAFHRFFSCSLKLNSKADPQALPRIQDPVGLMFSLSSPDGQIAHGICFSNEVAWAEWLSCVPFSNTPNEFPRSILGSGEQLAAVQSEVAVLAGRIVLPREVISRLAAGDMLRLWGRLRSNSPAQNEATALILKWGALAAMGHCDQWGDITVDQAFTRGADLASEYTQDHAGNLLTPEEALLGAPDCVVEFEVARITMPLQKLLTLAAGELIPLNNPLDQGEVTLLTAGKPFAKGRLVTVGAELAVVVTQVGGA